MNSFSKTSQTEPPMIHSPGTARRYFVPECQLFATANRGAHFVLDCRVQNYSAMREEVSVNKALRQFLMCGVTSLVVLLGALSMTAQNNWGGYNNNSNPYQGKLRGDDQKRFDDYYAKWVHDRDRKDLGEIASMEARMLDVYAHNNIQSNVPYDLVASPNVALPTNGYQNWRGRLSGDDQKRFDSYYTRWLEYRSKKDKEQIASMQGRMLDLYGKNNIPLTTPYEFIASQNVVPNFGFNPNMPPNNGGYGNNNNYNNGGNYNNGNLRILQASYGAAGRQTDVSGRLQSMINNQGLRVRVNNDSMGGDPAPNAHKQLYVVYFYQGQQRNVTVDEGNDLQIP